MKRHWFYLFLIFFTCATSNARGDAGLGDLKRSISQGEWDAAVEIANGILKAKPTQAEVRMTGANALFQKGYFNAGLLWINKINPQDWKAMPLGQDRLAEVILFFQKKVPTHLLPARIDQLDLNGASSYFRDEILFSRGRSAFEKRQAAEAEALLSQVAVGSRFYVQARYLIGAINACKLQYAAASTEFSKIFEPAILEKTTEFWRDLGTQMTSHWGTNLRVSIDSSGLADTATVGELAMLGLARSAYASKDFRGALGYYSKFVHNSIFYPRAMLEKIWTLLALGKHEEAQKTAFDFSSKDSSLEALEARILRAIVLTDAGETEDARTELVSFEKSKNEALNALKKFEYSHLESSLPPFLRLELQQDPRLKALRSHQASLVMEIETLRKSDYRLFPAYAELAVQLDPLVSESKALQARLIGERIASTRTALSKMALRARLIQIETYLEDREKLRTEFREKRGVTPEEQQSHDRRLIALLKSAIAESDAALGDVPPQTEVKLRFRQSELLWELGSAVAISSSDPKDLDASDALKKRALKTAEDIVTRHPEFDKHARALFFLGYMQNDQGAEEAAFRSLEQFIHKYPAHESAPDAYRMLADMLFEKNRFAEASLAYQKITSFQDSPVIGYAYYKMGWCSYNLHAFGRAILNLEKAIFWIENAAAQQTQISLKREAVNDLIAIYAEVGDYRKAWDYFGRFAQEVPAKLIARLSKEFDRTGQYERSSYLYRSLIARDSTLPENVEYQARIVDGASHLRNWKLVATEADELVSKYRTQIEKPKGQDDPAATAENILRVGTLTLQFEVEKSKKQDFSETIIHLAETYLIGFGNWDSSQEPLYRHARYLLAIGRTSEAAAAYRKHWTRFQSKLQEPLREESLRNLLSSLETLEAKAPTSPEMSKEAAEIIQYASQFEGDYKKSKHLRSISFLKSSMYFKYKRIDEAAVIAQALFDEEPNDDIGKRSFKNLRVAYYDRKNWKRTFEWSSRLSSRPSAPIELYHDDFDAIRREALFQWAESTSEDRESAKLFLQVANDPKMKTLQDRALYNAFLRLEKAGARSEALAIADRLEDSSPDFDALPLLSGIRAALYQESGDYAGAARHLEAFVNKPVKSADPATLAQARLNLALVYEGLEQPEKAMASLRQYLALGEKSPQLAPRIDEAKKRITRLQRQSSTAEKFGQSASWLKILADKAQFEKSPLTRDADLGEKIKGGAAKLDGLTKRILQFSENRQNSASNALESFCLLPFIYDVYASAVSGLAETPGLKPDETTELKRALAPIAAPVEAKAKELASQCLQKSVELEHDGPVFGEVVKRWGWRSDPALQDNVDRLIEHLAKSAPWLQQPDKNLTEKELFKRHLENGGDSKSWYGLSYARWMEHKYALARLTLEDALAKGKSSPQALNLLACIEQREKGTTPPIALFEKAANEGSAQAWANLALIHLKANHLSPGLVALKKAREGDAFDHDKDLRRQAEELERK